MEKSTLIKHEPVVLPEDFRRVHLDYNKHHYWKPPEPPQINSCEQLIQRYKNPEFLEELMNPELPKDFNCEEWLE